VATSLTLPAPRAGTAPAPRAAAPRSSKGIRTRARLLDAARSVFEDAGFVDARVSDISERAGLSHGSFYHYFDSKEQIFLELAADLDERLTAPLGEIILAPSSDVAAVDRLRTALRRHFESYRAEARLMGVVEQASRYDPQISVERMRRHRRYAAQIEASIRQLQQRGMADPALDPALAAAALGSVTYRFAELWLVQGAVSCTLDEATDQITTFLANALQLRPATDPHTRRTRTAKGPR
jgi:AcrR family transcriptional regulator